MNGPNIATPLIPEHFTFRRSAEGDDTRGLGSKEAGVGDDALNKFVVDIYIYMYNCFLELFRDGTWYRNGVKIGSERGSFIAPPRCLPENIFHYYEKVRRLLTWSKAVKY